MQSIALQLQTLDTKQDPVLATQCTSISTWYVLQIIEVSEERVVMAMQLRIHYVKIAMAKMMQKWGAHF